MTVVSANPLRTPLALRYELQVSGTRAIVIAAQFMNHIFRLKALPPFMPMVQPDRADHPPV